MATYQIENFGDLVATTQNKRGAPNITNAMSPLRDYPMARRILRDPRAGRTSKIPFKAAQGGPQIQFNVVVAHNNGARGVAITDTDQGSSQDGVISAIVPWRKYQTNYQIYYEEIIINQDPEVQINNLAEIREAQAMTALYELIDREAFGLPAEGDVRKFFSIPMWVPKSATASTGTSGPSGFTGKMPVGYSGSTLASLNPTTYDRWRSWAAPYTNPTPGDLLDKARDMARYTKFKAAVDTLPSFDTDKMATAKDVCYYTNNVVFKAMEDIADTKNDNHDSDVFKYGNSNITFQRVPVEMVPELDRDTTNPLYQIDWSTIVLVAHSRLFNKRFQDPNVAGRHNLAQTILEYLFNLVCYDRRKQGVLSTGTTYP